MGHEQVTAPDKKPTGQPMHFCKGEVVPIVSAVLVCISTSSVVNHCGGGAFGLSGLGSFQSAGLPRLDVSANDVLPWPLEIYQMPDVLRRSRVKILPCFPFGSEIRFVGEDRFDGVSEILSEGVGEPVVYQSDEAVHSVGIEEIRRRRCVLKYLSVVRLPFSVFIQIVETSNVGTCRKIHDGYPVAILLTGNTKGKWNKIGQIDPPSDDFGFGGSIDTNNVTGVFGNPKEDMTTAERGAVYVFSLKNQ